MFKVSDATTFYLVPMTDSNKYFLETVNKIKPTNLNEEEKQKAFAFLSLVRKKTATDESFLNPEVIEEFKPEDQVMSPNHSELSDHPLDEEYKKVQ